MTNPTDPQPPPVNAPDARAIWPLVCADLEAFDATCRYINQRTALLADARARDTFGRKKYGVSLVAENGRDHDADALQELLDALAYQRAGIELAERNGEDEVRLSIRRHAYEETIWQALRVRYLISTRGE